ncbi:hypothetical protein RA995_17880, partial [Mycobacteroides abscessus subsp. abscessus]
MDRLDGYLLLTMSDFEMYGCYLLDTDRYAAEGFHRGLTITLLERHVEGTWEAEAERRNVSPMTCSTRAPWNECWQTKD